MSDEAVRVLNNRCIVQDSNCPISDTENRWGNWLVDSHVHNENASFMELVDDFTWRHADGRHEEAGLLFDDNIYKIG